MIDARRLLTDLKRLRKQLEDDLRAHHTTGAGRVAVEAEWQEAFDAKRTADTFETFFSAALDQASVHWILGAVFLRFLEDNALIPRPLISGTGERMELARQRQQDYFRRQPVDSDAEYMLAMFAEAARLPGLSGLFDPAHNPALRLPLSGDGAGTLIEFFRRPVPETGALVHDFADPEWGTRFLGDLYQDLSEDARKRFALLQTPEFIEAWILDRTLEPAIATFGHEQVRMIDPTCGSGHFLLGGFARLLREWQRAAPDMPPAAAAQRALDAVCGIDLNPFAVEIARFRLLLAALQASGETRLSAAPDFRFQLAVGDSLLHGGHFRSRQHDLAGMAEGFERRLRHHYAAEDNDALNAILGRQYHAVVGNPPYITPKDAAMRDAYRELYTSCHMKYALAVPFVERFFDLTLPGIGGGAHGPTSGFVGMIVANSFMKREFGKKLIEEVLPRLDLTHVVDCSGAHIPGHGTPTVILFGRNRPPVSDIVRAVMGIRGEPETPDDPAHGLVWSAIRAQTDNVGSVSEFVSVADVSRATLARHPWSIGGGGASELKETIEATASQTLSRIGDIGVMAVTGEDDAYMRPRHQDFVRYGEPSRVRTFVEGDQVRDWRLVAPLVAYFPYDDGGAPAVAPGDRQLLWPYRAIVAAGIYFGKTKVERGMMWEEYGILVKSKSDRRAAITFAFVATHNHFVLDRGGKVFNRTAPMIKLPAGVSEEVHLGLLGLLNSSTASFWLKQTLMDRGNGGIGGGIANEPWERFFEHDGGKIGRFPLADSPPQDLACSLDVEAQRLSASFPAPVCARATPTRAALDAARAEAEAARARMIALQEELDWRCYRLYGLLDEAVEHANPPPLHLGERAFEIVLARRMAAGEVETAWFTRHRSTPITELPAHWPADYRTRVERRIALIETDPNIGLIERPEYKRRWAMAPWEEMERDALRLWLLDRLERPEFWPPVDPRILSTTQLADLARRDEEFRAVAELYAGPAAADLDTLVAELVAKEAVPFLAALRYSETGLRKRADWERTWEMQRAEDRIDAEIAAAMPDALPGALKAAQDRRKHAEVGPIPVPPKYRTPDFLSVDFWRLRGGLDVPKERFVSFPHCARDADGSLPILWAGYDHLARARAIATYTVERKERDGWPPERLAPLLAGLLELLPWLRQWHNEYDAEMGTRMGGYYAEFIRDEAQSIGMTEADLAAWTPPAPARRRGRRAAR
jgi:hypothetical protein